MDELNELLISKLNVNTFDDFKQVNYKNVISVITKLIITLEKYNIPLENSLYVYYTRLQQLYQLYQDNRFEWMKYNWSAEKIGKAHAPYKRGIDKLYNSILNSCIYSLK